MPDYRLFHLERGRVCRADVMIARDDDSALLQAAQKIDERHAELWRGAVKIRTFNLPADSNPSG